MRIPITIKIPINEAGKPSSLAAARVAIHDLSAGLEKISVRIFKRRDNQLQKYQPAIGREITKPPAHHPIVYRPKPRTAANTYSRPKIRPKVNYSVKTFHITLTWPTLSIFDGLAKKLKALSKRAWAIIGLLAIAVIVVIVYFNQPGKSASGNKNHASPSASINQLVRGTPKYATILPTGKTAEQLGGWTRVSPPSASPVYAYVDKIDKVSVSVSEQPLPKSFQEDTSTKIAQLAANYNATDKFTAANNTKVYIASSGTGRQSVILTKSGLLILIKSAAPISNNSWVNYISSLK